MDYNTEQTTEVNQLSEGKIKITLAELTNIRLAAQAGQDLLEQNSVLRNELNATIAEMSARIEALEQEKYSLQQKLDHMVMMEKDYIDEIDMLKFEKKHQQAEKIEALQNEHRQKINQLRHELDSVQTEFEQSQLSCRQLKDRCAELEQLLCNAREHIDRNHERPNETSSEELAQLQSKVIDLENEKISLMHKLREALEAQEQQEHSTQRLVQLIESKQAELEEAECKATAYWNALEKAKEEVTDLKVQLDVAKMESQNRNKKGNSLFSEVEDRRVAAEKELISLRVKHDLLKKEFDLTRQHELSLKRQLAILLQKASSGADLNRLQCVEEELYLARAEIETLHKQLADLQPQSQSDVYEIYKDWSEQMRSKDSFSVDFMNQIVKTKDETINNLKRQLAAASLQMLDKSQRVLEHQKKIYEYERELENKQKTITRQFLKLEEYRVKYKEDSNHSSKMKSGKVEKIPTAVSLDKKSKDRKNPWSSLQSLSKETFPQKRQVMNKATKKGVSFSNEVIPQEENVPHSLSVDNSQPTKEAESNGTLDNSNATDHKPQCEQ